MTRDFLGEFEQMVLLAILREAKDGAFALEVRRRIEVEAGRSVSRGAFYTTLDRLERKGMVEWEEAVPEDFRRTAPIRRFRVTPLGLEALRSARQAMEALSRGLDQILEGTT